MNGIQGFIVGVCLAILLVTIPMIFITWNCWETEAIEKGYAEYYLNKNHQKRWRWLCDEKEDQGKED